MTDTFIVALSTILGAMIGGFAALIAAQNPTGRRITGAFLGFAISLFAGIGLIVGIFLLNYSRENGGFVPAAISTGSAVPYPISSQLVDQLAVFGETTDEVVQQNCLNVAHEGGRPFRSFVSGETIPSNALVSTNFAAATLHHS